MADRMYPGHIYLESLGTGIQWTPKKIFLRGSDGAIVEAAPHRSKTVFDFFYNLEFAESFPSVTHWWFRSAWTQKVRLTGPQGLADNDTVWGYMQFIDQDTPSQRWTATTVDGGMTEIYVPYPPNEVQPINLPLRLALARLVAGVLADEVPRDTWMIVTSLVNRNELEATFPISSNALRWRLEGVNGSIRDEWIRTQGIKLV